MTIKRIAIIIFCLGLFYGFCVASNDQFERETTERIAFELEILKAEQKQFEDFRFGRSREINELAESEYE